jgi:hypothetical protein
MREATAACRSKLRHLSISSRGAPTSSDQFHNSNGVAMPTPAMRPRSAGAKLSLELADAPTMKLTISSGSG